MVPGTISDMAFGSRCLKYWDSWTLWVSKKLEDELSPVRVTMTATPPDEDELLRPYGAFPGVYYPKGAKYQNPEGPIRLKGVLTVLLLEKGVQKKQLDCQYGIRALKTLYGMAVGP